MIISLTISRNLKRTLALFFVLLVFVNCVSNKTSSSNNYKKTTYYVSNLKEFLTALGHNRKIVLTNDIYIKEELSNVVTDTSKLLNRSKYKGWFTPEYVTEFYDIKASYTSSIDTKESLCRNNFEDFINDEIILVIKQAHNLEITSRNSSKIILSQSEDEVIRFDSVQNFKLRKLTVFHKPESEGGCGEFAPVITFHNSRQIKVENCKLNGSGTEGIYTKNVENISIVNTKIFNCNKRGISFENSKNVSVEGCKVFSNNLDADSLYWKKSSIFNLRESDIEVSNTIIKKNTSKDKTPFIDMDAKSSIKFNNCKISNNSNFVISKGQKAFFSD